MAQVGVLMENLLDSSEVLPSVSLLQVLNDAILAGESSGSCGSLPHEILAHTSATLHVGILPPLD